MPIRALPTRRRYHEYWRSVMPQHHAPGLQVFCCARAMIELPLSEHEEAITSAYRRAEKPWPSPPQDCSALMSLSEMISMLEQMTIALTKISESVPMKSTSLARRAAAPTALPRLAPSSYRHGEARRHAHHSSSQQARQYTRLINNRPSLATVATQAKSEL